jgi:molecular chaperone GrpE
MAQPGEEIASLGEVAMEEAKLQIDAAEEARHWRDRALRLQAEMDNYRKRQQRAAEERIRAESERLLKAFLVVVDDLERALNASEEDGTSLRDGVAMTHRAAMKLLAREGVSKIEAEDQAFNPAWHEAVATVQSKGSGEAPGTVVQVLEAGYQTKERLLRPAKVVVAV